MANITVFELTDARRLPRIMAEIRRMNRNDGEWCVDEHGTAWLKVDDAPPRLLFHAEIDPTIRAHQEWQNKQRLSFRNCPGQFCVDGNVTLPTVPTPTSRIAVAPRLLANRAIGTPELWIVADVATLKNWLTTADDRLVDRLEVARFQSQESTKIVLHARRGRGGPPILVLDADAYRPYLKLPTLFVPIGRKMVPPLRRDLALRAFAPESDHIVWLDDHGHRSSIVADAFQPLTECVRYGLPRVLELASISIEPVFYLDTCDANDRPAGARIDLAAGDADQPGRLAMIWDQNQWRILPTRSKS